MKRRWLKILFITALDLGRPDGAIAHLVGLERALHRRGHRTFFLSPYPRAIRLRPAGDFLFIPCIRITGLRYLTYNLFSPFYILYALYRFRPDIVIVRDFPGKIIKYIFAVFSPHTPILVHNASTSRGFSHRFVIIRSKYTGAKDRPQFLPFEGPGVDPTLFFPMDMEKVREKLGFSLQIFIIGATSSPGAGDNYNYNLLLEAFGRFCAKYQDSILLIMGEIPRKYKQDFFKIAREKGLLKKVFVTGLVSQQELCILINACDVVVAPISRKRLISNPYHSGAVKLWEYFACAKPVIKTDIEVTQTYHWFKDNCVLVPPDDEEAFTEALFRLYENPFFRKELGERAYKWAMENHSYDKRVEKIEEFFLKIGRGF